MHKIKININININIYMYILKYCNVKGIQWEYKGGYNSQYNHWESI